MSYHKYRNTPTTIDGVKFDSASESRRYCELKLLMQSGIIRDLELQPEYELIPKYTNAQGKKVQAAHYRADFRYWDNDTNSLIIEDVKSEQTTTPVYKLKKKLAEYRYPELIIREVDA